MSEGFTVLANPEHQVERLEYGLTASSRMGECRFYLFLDGHDRLRCRIVSNVSIRSFSIGRMSA
jgi:hypothetical protein